VRPDVVAIDVDLSQLEHADEFRHRFRTRFFDMWIAEQQLVATAGVD